MVAHIFQEPWVGLESPWGGIGSRPLYTTGAGMTIAQGGNPFDRKMGAGLQRTDRLLPVAVF